MRLSHSIHSEGIGDADQCLVAVELAVAFAQVGIAIFHPRGDVIADGALDAAADQPAIAVFRCGSEARRIIEGGPHPGVPVAAARVEQGVCRSPDNRRAR